MNTGSYLTFNFVTQVALKLPRKIISKNAFKHRKKKTLSTINPGLVLSDFRS